MNQLRVRVIAQLVQTNLEGSRTILSVTTVDKGVVSMKCLSAALFCRPEQPKLDSTVLPVGIHSTLCMSEWSSRRKPCRTNCVILRHWLFMNNGRQDLVPESKIIERDAVTIRCAHGDTVLYPVTQLELEVDGLLLCVETAVSKSLSVPV